MTANVALHARAVLSDCESAFAELRAANQETLRRRWLTMLALLRAVGHVLKNVDSDTSEAHRRIILEKWKEMNATKPQYPAILWGFIEQERNDVLKQYRFAVRGNLTIEIPTARPPLPVGTNYDAVEPTFNVWPLISVRFEHEEPFVVVQQAVDFWREYLDDVDRRIAVAQQKEQKS
jgi:hypothetical protein